MPVNSFENYPMAWKPQKENLTKPYYLSIASCLENDILTGKLPEDAKLPPQRELADYLDLNLSTITRAYKLCELKGLLYAVTGRGTFVSPGLSAQDTFLDKSIRPNGLDSAVGPIELGMIRPFYECNPIVQDAAKRVLQRTEATKLFEYSEPLGTRRQLNAALQWLHRLGIPAAKENILLSAGAQNALSVILISLFKAGDKIAVDDFTYTNFKELAHFLHIQLIAVPADESGMSPDALARVCQNTEVKGVYLMPTCSNPTGIFMPPSRRLELAEIIQRHGLLLIEDDIYSFLAPDGTRSFFSLLPEQTIHICSTSKSLCAGLRVAFLAFPGQYKEQLISGMLSINLKTVSLNGEIIAELIESGDAEKIVTRKKILARKRNRIFTSVFPENKPDSVERFFHWLELPEHLTSEELELLALQKGVRLLGSHRFAMRNEKKSAYVRVSVTSPDTDAELKRGLLVLKSVLEERQRDFFV
ncbi:MAG: PLP-dependent aminotransferase family protein [Lachnospiraceae bacterium]|nr:PLP-dependent aminotransferase family protein [Lachnospiraceae bacterium]